MSGEVNLKVPKKYLFLPKIKMFQTKKENDGTLLRFSDFRSAKRNLQLESFSLNPSLNLFCVG